MGNMKKIIGFANKFYTLWEYENVTNYVTDAYGKHHASSVTTHYYYIKNVSFSLDKVKEMYPGVSVDENVRGKVRDFSETKPLEKGLPENYFWNGRYRGMLVDEILVSDFNYCLWYADNGLWATANNIKGHPIYKAHFQAIEDEKNRILSNTALLKEGDVVEFECKSNAYNGDGEGNDAVIEARFGNVTIYITGLSYKMVHGRFIYAMPMINGKFQRTRNKTIKVEVSKILNVSINRHGDVSQTIKIK